MKSQYSSYSLITEDQLKQLHSVFLQECKSEEYINLPSIGSENISIPCKDVNASTPENFIDLVGGEIFDTFYYNEYSCNFIECLKQPGEEKLLVIVSLKGHEFFKNIQLYFWDLTAVGLLILLVSIDTWGKRLKTLGWGMILVGLPFVIFDYTKNIVLKNIPANLVGILNSVISSVSYSFLIVLAVGVVLLLSGFMIEFRLKKKNETPKTSKR